MISEGDRCERQRRETDSAECNPRVTVSLADLDAERSDGNDDGDETPATSVRGCCCWLRSLAGRAMMDRGQAAPGCRQEAEEERTLTNKTGAPLQANTMRWFVALATRSLLSKTKTKPQWPNLTASVTVFKTRLKLSASQTVPEQM